MADREIGTLTAVSSLSADDLFLVRQSGEARKVTVQQLKTEFGGGGSGGTAGAYRFNVNEEGELVLIYEGTTPPAYSINEDGDLILTLDDGQTINVGHVQGRNGKAGTTPTIGSNGHWFLGSVDTGVKARGDDGKDGIDGSSIDGIEVEVDDEYLPAPYCEVATESSGSGEYYKLSFHGLRGYGISDIHVEVDDTASDTPTCSTSYSEGVGGYSYLFEFSGIKGKDGIDGTDGKDNLPTVESVSGATVSLTLDNNVEYRCADTVTSLALDGFTAATDGKASMWAMQFTAGDGIAVTVPETVKWAVADPIWTAGVTYWLSFVPLITGKILGVWASDE